MNRKTTIGQRITVLVSASVFAAVAIASSTLAFIQVNHDLADKRANMETMAYVFASAVADSVVAEDRLGILNVIRSISRIPAIKNATVLKENGRIVASLGQRAVLASDNLGTEPDHFSMLTRGIMPVAVDIVKNGGVAGKIILMTDVSDVRTEFARTVLLTLGAAFAAAILGVLISRPLQRRITGPIVRLTASMRQLRETRSFSTTIEADSSDEAGVLVETFNGLIADIHDRDLSLQKLAYHDALTGLPNRTHFQKLLNEKIASRLTDNSGVAVVLFNIDAFHALNDAFGHGIGDAILMNIAALIKSEAGDTAAVARVGGDEFAVIVSDTGNGLEAESLIARVQAVFYRPLEFLNMELHITLSAGATLMPRDSTTVGDAMRHVDLAVNAAKEIGPGRAVFFRSEMDNAVRLESELAQSLRLAIDNSELSVHFQPQWDLNSKAVTGYEALLRWKHPVHGNISPAVFIPVAERSGQINIIGTWILLNACHQAMDWLHDGEAPRTVAINISPAQVLQSGFVRTLANVLAETGLPPELLCLELTENLFLGRSLVSVHGILDEIRELGVTLALDDFGTGFSSLSYLSQLPFDKLKIDRSFVSCAQNSPRRTEILRAIILMAHSLGMTVIAEGAENEDELALLVALNADQVQGFAIAKPESAYNAHRTAATLEARYRAPKRSNQSRNGTAG